MDSVAYQSFIERDHTLFMIAQVCSVYSWCRHPPFTLHVTVTHLHHNNKEHEACAADATLAS